MIISGAEDNLQLLDEIRAEVGDDPDVWRPILWERVQARKMLTHAKSLHTQVNSH